MALPLAMLGASAASNLIGGMVAGDAQRSAMNKARAAQKDHYVKMQRMLESIGIPTIEAQKLVLERPDYAGDLITEKLGPSALEELQEDSRLRQAKMDALNQLQEIGEVGLTPEERAQREEMLRESAAQGQAQQKAILQNMAQRGNLDSGASLIAQLQANAEQTADARRASEQMAADVARRRREAIMRAADVAGNISNADMRRDINIATAKDRINQFNVQNSNRAQERNLDARQRYNTADANIVNREQEHNKSLINNRYNQEMDRFKALNNLSSGNTNSQVDHINARGNASAQQASQMGAAIGGIATKLGDYFSKK